MQCLDKMVGMFRTFFFSTLFIFGCAGSSLCGLFSSCSEWNLLFLGVLRLLIVVVLLWRTGSRHSGFSSCGSLALEFRLCSCGAPAWLLLDMWNLPGSGIRLMYSALAGGILSTASPGKPSRHSLCLYHKEMRATFICS